MTHTDPFHLHRFVSAQEPVYADVLAELRAGRKRSHWMWFVFPQPRGLGSSAMSQRYALAGRAEARAYLAHPLLGTRLLECTALVNDWVGHRIEALLGSPDDLKFFSSMTMFDAVAGQGTVFDEALACFFDGQRDPRALAMLD